VGQIFTLASRCGNYAVVNAAADWSNAGTINLTDLPAGCGNYFAQLATAAGKTLTNTGRIHVQVGTGTTDRYLSGTADNSGTVEVDAGAILLKDSGTFSNKAAGTIETHIASPTSFGKILGPAPIQLDGTLKIDTAYSPAVHDAFQVISCAGCVSGAFAAYVGQSLPGDLGYAVGIKASGVKLTVKKVADLDLLGSAPSPVASGSQFSYTFTVHNAGPKPATAVKLSDTLPAGVTFVSASAGCTTVGAKVTCALGTLNSGASSIVTITVTAGAPATVTNIASVKAGTVDFTPADARAKVKVTIV
jgi:uncharacterized repeat protein (TIGR01451 family)